MEILKAEKINKKYGEGKNEFYAIKNINLSVNKGEFIAITGKSGSGKSTLIHILSGLDSLDEGKVYINNEDIFKLKDEKLTIFRRKNIGIIYQFYNLLPMLNVRENILLPSLLDKKKVNPKRFKNMIKTLELESKLDEYPNNLSGGQQQRTSIGRALINRPKILFADEPTGNLDSKNSMKIMKLLKYYNKKYKQTIIMVTHDKSLARMCDRNVYMKDGKIIKDEYKKISKKQK